MVVTDSCSQDRYEALMRMMREWRHLLLLKRGGRGNEPEGPSGTLPGELALKCPACPHPEINLPSNWKTAPPDKAYVLDIFFFG